MGQTQSSSSSRRHYSSGPPTLNLTRSQQKQQQKLQQQQQQQQPQKQKQEQLDNAFWQRGSSWGVSSRGVSSKFEESSSSGGAIGDESIANTAAYSIHSFDDRKKDSCGLEFDVDSLMPGRLVQFDSAEFPVVLNYKGKANEVFVAGSWDGWKEQLPLRRSMDDFSTIISLPEGRHKFRFIVDGCCVVDSHFGKLIDPETLKETNVITVDKSDFEVFDALDRDLHDVDVLRRRTSENDGTSGVDATNFPTIAIEGSMNPKGVVGCFSTTSRKYSGPFTQEIPDKELYKKVDPPPNIPPYLMQVILNKDLPLACDPNALPEPHHTMLNHLYALSIKEGVMVLSATHRYRKKFVTTLIYRPI